MSQFKSLTKKEPEKSLLLSQRSTGGRGAGGRVTVRHRGGGVKQQYRIINFGQEMINVPATVKALEYDPNRTGFLALLEYEGGVKKYIIAPQNLNIGDSVIIAEKAEAKIGNRMQLQHIPSGADVYNIELEPGRGGKMVRGAGTSAKILTQEAGFTHLKMPSGEVRKVRGECFATMGVVSRPDWKYTNIGKAGRSRLRGWRPAVRGVAMNPVSHPHGGGEGRSSVGMKHPKTPWGKPALGVKTRKRKKWTSKFILQRRKKNK